MKKPIKLLIISVFIISAGYAQKTEIGKPAPKIEIEKWIYPEILVENFDVKRKIPDDLKGKVIVLDFWFTKCAPCVASIPHLNSLAKKYPDVVFLSISFEFEGVLKDFLSENILYYPVGSDVQERVIKAFGVTGYPHTFVITGDNRIAWDGSPFQLSEEVLDFFTGRDTGQSLDVVKENETKTSSQAYTFTITENTTHDPQSSYTHTYPWDINIYNKNLGDILEQYSKIGKSRMIKNDSSLLKKRYDITLKADKDYVTAANCPEIIKYLLPDALGSGLNEIKVDTVYYLLSVVNDSLASMHKSNQPGTGITFRFDNWEARGITLEGIKQLFEDKYGVLTETDKNNNMRFDIMLPVNDFEEAKETLANEYGIGFKKVRGELDFLEIGEK